MSEVGGGGTVAEGLGAVAGPHNNGQEAAATTIQQ